MNNPKYKIFKGPLLNPRSDYDCDYWSDGSLILERTTDSCNYSIFYAGPQHDLDHVFKNELSIEIYEKSDCVIMPSFFDLHFHWVQDDVRLKPRKELLAWLKEYTWPHETKFQSEDYSRHKAIEFAQHLVKTGTLSGAVYGSPHAHTVHHAHEYFIGDFVVGNPLMTMNSPHDLKQLTDHAYVELKELAKKYTNRYAVTPRIAAVTDPELMTKGAHLAKETNAFIQTHLCETLDEINWILDIYRKIPGFEDAESYTDIYDRCHILQDRTILGHCNYLSEQELELIRNRKAAIAHCPSSNAPVSQGGLGSGLFDFRLSEKYNIPWGLGSDIGGGPWLSMLDVIHSFVQQNRHHDRFEATYIKGLYRATLKSAQILRMDNVLGNLLPGKWANFIVVPFPENNKTYDNVESVLENIIAPLANERHRFDELITEVFYKGNNVYRQ